MPCFPLNGQTGRETEAVCQQAYAIRQLMRVRDAMAKARANAFGGGKTRNSESAQLGTCKTSPEVSLWRFGSGSYFSLVEPAGIFKIGPTESETFCRGVNCNEVTPFTGALSFFMQAACLQPQHVKGDVTQSCKYGG